MLEASIDVEEIRMAIKGRVLTQIWKAFKDLNPKNVTDEARRFVRVAVVGPAELLHDTTAFLLGEEISAYDRVGDILLLFETPLTPAAIELVQKCDLVLISDNYKDTLPGIPTKRIFRYSSTIELPEVIKHILAIEDLDYIHLPLARALPAFRPLVTADTIQTVSIENSVFVASTSLGNIIPNPLQPLTSIAEALGDLIVLTANQLRMLFRLAAANGRDLGFKEQTPEVLSVVGAAFGWRSIARELVAQLPAGLGVVPKAAIAFAGTWAIGDGINYYYTTGHRLTKEELKTRFDLAYEKGKSSAEAMVSRLKDEYAKRKPYIMNKPG